MKHLEVKSVKPLTPPDHYSFVWTCPCGSRNGGSIELSQIVTEEFCIDCGAKCEITVEWSLEET